MRKGIILVIIIAAVGTGVKLFWPKAQPSTSNADPAQNVTPTTQPTTRPAIPPPPPAGSISITPTSPRPNPGK
jgi:hypothetical protein